MPLEVAFWKVEGNSATRVPFSAIDSEKRLEDLVTADIRIVSDDLLVIGRQVKTRHGKVVDILAIDGDGKLTIIELKKGRTSREVVAQALDYGAWASTIDLAEVKAIFLQQSGKELDAAFAERFDVQLPELLAEEPALLILCAELDPESERIVQFLAERYAVPINVLFFRYLRDGGSDYLSRAWMIDPADAKERAVQVSAKAAGEAWNGNDFVVNVDSWEGQTLWPDEVKYGFVGAGGGRWYISSLQKLHVGARVFVMIPGKGYVGVGIVKETAVPMRDFTVQVGTAMVPIAQAPLTCEVVKAALSESDDDTEHFARVEWIKTVKESEAYWEKGLRANQNSAFRLKNDYTLRKLLAFFGLEV